MDNFVQFMILILGAATVALIAFEGRRHYWGLWCGLLSEPFWIYSSWENGQWGIIILSFWYAWFYAYGAWVHHRKMKPWRGKKVRQRKEMS